MKKTFKVLGMSCASCVSHVERAVKNTVGVNDVVVNLLTENMVVDYDESVCTAEDIEKAVAAAGYSASVDEVINEVHDRSKAEGQTDGKSVEKGQKGLSGLTELIISGVLLLVLMYFSMGNMMWNFPVPDIVDHKANPLGFAIIQLVLLIPILIIYRRYFISGYKKLFRGAPNMDTLVAIGSTASLLYGIAAIIIMGYATSRLGSDGLSIEQISAYKSIIATYHDNLYFESAGTILTLVSLGKYLEGLSKKKTTRALENLAELAPSRAVILVDGEEKEVGIESVKKGDTVVIKKGDIIPIDGELISGCISVDQSNITGESIPITKNVGDGLFASTVVTAGYARAVASKVGEDTSFSAIVKLVEEGANSKAPISRLADKISAIFVPLILIIGVLTFVLNWVIGGSFELALNFAVTVIVIACPCALGLATPVAIMVGTGKAAELGLLIKNAEILERTKSVDVVVLDKTGTITQGKPSVVDFICYTDGEQTLNAVYSIENMSEHPLALALCEYAKENNGTLLEVKNYTSKDGIGIFGEVNGDKYGIGNARIIDNALNYSEWAVEYEGFASQGKTPLYVVKNDKIVGLVTVKDLICENAEIAVKRLIDRHIDVIMLTGDNEKTARAVANEVGIQSVIAGVLPQDKQGIIKDLKQSGKVVAMVGDGVNDAPALTMADIGIAVGGGSDVAVSSGDIVLLKKDLQGVATAIDLSKFVLLKIKLGLFWAFFYNVVCVFIATGILYYVCGLKISPMIGALAMSFSSLSVVLNALSINLFKSKSKGGTNITSEVPEPRNDKLKYSSEEKNRGSDKMTTVIKVNGMMCGHCVMHVEKAVMSVEGVILAKADLENKQVTVEHNGADIEEVKRRIKEAGYEVE